MFPVLVRSTRVGGEDLPRRPEDDRAIEALDAFERTELPREVIRVARVALAEDPHLTDLPRAGVARGAALELLEDVLQRLRLGRLHALDGVEELERVRVVGSEREDR